MFGFWYVGFIVVLVFWEDLVCIIVGFGELVVFYFVVEEYVVYD